MPATGRVARTGSPGLVSRTVSRSVSSPRVVLAVGAVAGALALTGCGAGQITQTSSQVSGVGGASANVGQIGVREAAFAFTGDGKTAAIYRAGGTAPLAMTVVNFGASGRQADGGVQPGRGVGERSAGTPRSPAGGCCWSTASPRVHPRPPGGATPRGPGERAGDPGTGIGHAVGGRRPRRPPAGPRPLPPRRQLSTAPSAGRHGGRCSAHRRRQARRADHRPVSRRAPPPPRSSSPV